MTFILLTFDPVQVLHCQSLHTKVRAQCVEFLKKNRENYEAVCICIWWQTWRVTQADTAVVKLHLHFGQHTAGVCGPKWSVFIYTTGGLLDFTSRGSAWMCVCLFAFWGKCVNNNKKWRCTLSRFVSWVTGGTESKSARSVFMTVTTASTCLCPFRAGIIRPRWMYMWRTGKEVFIIRRLCDYIV